jgi:hypothetical protein
MTKATERLTGAEIEPLFIEARDEAFSLRDEPADFADARVDTNRFDNSQRI